MLFIHVLLALLPFSQASELSFNCDTILLSAFPLEFSMPPSVLLRPTRLQKLLETTKFDELPASQKDPEVTKLISSATAKWMKLPRYAQTIESYVQFFSMEDLLLMAAHQAYAKKVASDLRTYANIHLGGSTSIFRNDDIYRSARLLVDRYRLAHNDFAKVESKTDLANEARAVGLKSSLKAGLSFVSGLSPAEIAQKTMLKPEGDFKESLIGIFAGKYSATDPEKSDRFIGLTETLDYGVILPNAITDANQVTALLMLGLKQQKERIKTENPLSGYSDVRHLHYNFSESPDQIAPKLNIREAKFAYQYRLSKIPVIRIPPAFSGSYSDGISAAVPNIPTAKIESYRRITRINFDFLGIDPNDSSQRQAQTPKTLNGFVYVVEPWFAFDDATSHTARK